MKVKHIEILECVESRTLFKILGRHRTIRELNKGKLSCEPVRLGTGERSIMDNVYWAGSKNKEVWSKLYTLPNDFNRPYGFTMRDKKYLRHKLLGQHNK